MDLRGSIALQIRRQGGSIYMQESGAPRLWIVVVDKNSAHIFIKTSLGVEKIGETNLSENTIKISGENDPLSNFTPPGPPEPPYEPAMKAARRRAFRFAYEMSSWLNLALAHEAYDRLIIIAPPQMLADMRRFFSKAVQSRIVAEINRDLTRIDDDNLQDDLEKNNFF